MEIELCVAAAVGNGPQLAALDDLLARVEDGVHTLRVDHPDLVEDTPWFRGLRPHRQELVRLILEGAVWRRPNPLLRIGQAAEAHRARAQAFSPLTIVTENEDSDGALVEAAVLAYADDETRAAWLAGAEATPRGWEIDSRGGLGQMPAKIRGLKRGELTPRALALCDSDREMPPNPQSSDQTGRSENVAIGDVRRALQDAGLSLGESLLVLTVRSAENLLPDAFWRLRLQDNSLSSAQKDAVQVLFVLSPAQRDHLNLEGDRRLSPAQVASNTVGPLFDGREGSPALTPAQLRALSVEQAKAKQGLNLKKRSGGAGIRDAFLLLLPNDVRAGRVTAADLNHRDQYKDLRALVDRIRNQL